MYDLGIEPGSQGGRPVFRLKLLVFKAANAVELIFYRHTTIKQNVAHTLHRMSTQNEGDENSDNDPQHAVNVHVDIDNNIEKMEIGTGTIVVLVMGFVASLVVAAVATYGGEKGFVCWLSKIDGKKDCKEDIGPVSMIIPRFLNNMCLGVPFGMIWLFTAHRYHTQGYATFMRVVVVVGLVILVICSVLIAQSSAAFRMRTQRSNPQQSLHADED